jgi:threonine dehydrogenase-like Zn-dependent dehydrogenase
MTTTMKAVVLSERINPILISVKEVPIPAPTAGSVVVQILATAILDYMREVLTGARPYPMKVPLIPGGNGIGRISAIGPDAASLKVGQLVLIDSYIRARDDTDAGFLLGLHAGADPRTHKLAGGPWRNGTLAQYANIPLENVHSLDEQRLCGELGYHITELSAILACTVAYGGLDDAGVKSGDIVIVAPATGNFGGAAVVTALAMGANVIACGRNQETLDGLAKAIGSPSELKAVKLTGDVEKDTVAIFAATGPGGADVYIDFSPPAAGEGGKTPTHMNAAIGVLRFGGTCSLMGGITGMVGLPYALIMFKNLIIRGRFMYRREQFRRVIKLAEQGKLKLGKAVGREVIGPYSLNNVVEALEMAEKSPGWAKTVIVTP